MWRNCMRVKYEGIEQTELFFQAGRCFQHYHPCGMSAEQDRILNGPIIRRGNVLSGKLSFDNYTPINIATGSDEARRWNVSNSRRFLTKRLVALSLSSRAGAECTLQDGKPFGERRSPIPEAWYIRFTRWSGLGNGSADCADIGMSVGVDVLSLDDVVDMVTISSNIRFVMLSQCSDWSQ